MGNFKVQSLFMLMTTKAVNEIFMEKILDGLFNLMTVSKVEWDKFRYTGLNVEALNDSIEVSMQEYVISLKDVEYIRKTETLYDSQVLN